MLVRMSFFLTGIILKCKCYIGLMRMVFLNPFNWNQHLLLHDIGFIKLYERCFLFICLTLCFIDEYLCVDYKELRLLNRDLQLQVLVLADVLVERPSQYAKRIGDISSIFKNCITFSILYGLTK